MTPADLERLYAAAFPMSRPWSEAEWAALLDRPGAGLVTHAHGAALIDVVGPEAELLTIAVDPARQGCGIGTALLKAAVALARRRGARRMVLEIAADNAAALALYSRSGFATVGRRPGYYRRTGGARIDAIVLALASLGAERAPGAPESG